MTLERITAKEILDRTGMVDRPEYYSGRGATTDDLNYTKLSRLYDLIKEDLGEAPSNQFVNMVASIPKLTATDFLLSLYRLEENQWVWEERLLPREKGIYVGDEGSAWGTVLEVLSGSSETDQTEIIRSQFLCDRGIKQEKHHVYYDGVSTFKTIH